MGLVNQAKTGQLIVTEIILNVCNHMRFSSYLDSFSETYCLFRNAFFGPVISAAVSVLH